MERIASLNLIHFLDFYFAFMFLVATWRRIGQYQSVARLVIAGPGRWPHLINLIRQYRTIFLTWSTVTPALMALALWLVQVIASRWIWPEAGTVNPLTIARLVELWPALFVVVPAAIAMFGFDFYGLYRVGQFDREQIETHLDQAEYWLKSKAAHVVRVVSFGYLNPRRMVATEVEKALLAVSDMLNYSLWWVTIQISLRVCFGVSLWLTWAVTR
jgi:hypothetical protein